MGLWDGGCGCMGLWDVWDAWDVWLWDYGTWHVGTIRFKTKEIVGFQGDISLN